MSFLKCIVALNVIAGIVLQNATHLPSYNTSGAYINESSQVELSIPKIKEPIQVCDKGGQGVKVMFTRQSHKRY